MLVYNSTVPIPEKGNMGITLATKCAVDEKIFIDISEAGIDKVSI